MKIISSLAIVCFFSFINSAVLAADQVDHKAHHPDSATSSINAAKKDGPNTNDKMAQESMDKMESQMKMMNDMHEKMMNAKTPEERKSLMAEHMKAMQGGMTMMNSMSNHSTMKEDEKNKMEDGMKCDMETHHKMMEKRMKMMEVMMQMMMDRMSP